MPTPERTEIPYAELIADSVPAGERIAYGIDSLQFGEIRLPSGKAKVPLVILIHGGCWRAEYDLTHLSQAAAAITRAGFATWSIEYRRIGDPGGGWPGTFTDVASAVDFSRELFRRFPRLDHSRVVIAGHSAGGQLAIWAASRKRGERLDGTEVGKAPLEVAGVVSLAGITDLQSYGAGTGGCNSSVGELMGGTPADFPGRYGSVSPIERAPIGVRMIFVHGTADSIVPVSESSAMLERERGGNATLTLVQSAGHFDLIAPFSRAWRDVMAAVRALTSGTQAR